MAEGSAREVEELKEFVDSLEDFKTAVIEAELGLMMKVARSATHASPGNWRCAPPLRSCAKVPGMPCPAGPR